MGCAIRRLRRIRCTYNQHLHHAEPALLRSVDFGSVCAGVDRLDGPQSFQSACRSKRRFQPIMIDFGPVVRLSGIDTVILGDCGVSDLHPPVGR